MAELVLCRPRAVLTADSPSSGLSIRASGEPLTGEPDAGNPPVRFGGRGGRDQPAFPTPIPCRLAFKHFVASNGPIGKILLLAGQ